MKHLCIKRKTAIEFYEAHTMQTPSTNRAHQRFLNRVITVDTTVI